jgi:hypothetical protein
LSFEFDYRVLSERLRLKAICGSDNSTNENGTLSNDDLRNGSRREGEREKAPAKQHQGKD